MCAAGNQLNPFLAQQAEWKKTLHMPSLPLMWVWDTHSHTLLHAHTAMPTCLSVRFYHHRDTVDSSFVCAEKISECWDPKTPHSSWFTKAVAMHLYVCSVFWLHTEKGSRMRTTGGTEKPVSLFQHSFPNICSCVLMSLALCELLNTLRSAGVVFQKKKEVKY